MAKPVFEQVTDRVISIFKDSCGESIVGLAHHAFWTLNKEKESFIVILEKGSFTTTKMEQLYKQSYETALKSGTTDVVTAISKIMLQELNNYAHTNWTIVDEDKIVCINLGAPNTNPYVAHLVNNQKVGYMNMHRVTMWGMPKDRADQLDELRNFRSRILGYTVARASKSIETGILSGQNAISAKAKAV